ncbi:MAG: hypothetical protein Q7S12_00025 [bacterium]|nr:hypothetical protein [bacterium]
MAQRKAGKRHIRNIQRSGGSYYVTIPIEVIKKLKWKERQKVEVKKSGKDSASIKDWKK